MDVGSILNSVMGSAGAGINQAKSTIQNNSSASGLLGGAAAGGIMALLLSNKKARKIGGKALTYGGMAAVGGLAYKAWRDYKSAQGGTQGNNQANSQAQDQAQAHHPSPAAPHSPPAYTPPANSIFDLDEPHVTAQGDDLRLVIIRAMISAAKCDGHIDATERQRIEAQIESLGIGANEQQFLKQQLAATSDPIQIARLSDGEEQAAEIYAASVIAVDIDTPEERRYLDRLADALLLPQDLRERIEAEAAQM